MRRSKTALSFGLAALAASYAALTAAPRDELVGSFGEYLEIQLVNVELFAVDRQGRPVLDLARDEIRVFEDGHPVELSFFVPPHAPPADLAGRAAESPASSAAARGLSVALFVDNVNTGPASRNRVFEQLWEVLEERLRPEDRVMVASYDGRLNIRQSFTRDRRELLEALREVEGLAAGRLAPDVREQRLLEVIEWHQEQQFLGAGGGGRFGRPGAGDPCVHVGNLARQHADEIYGEVQGTLGALTDFVNSLAGIPGRKVLIHVSDGIPLIAGGEAFNFAIELCDGTGAQDGIQGAMDMDRAMSGSGRLNRFNPTAARSDMLQYDTTEDWQRLAAHANAQRVVFYPAFAAGLVSPSRAEANAVRTTFRTENERVRNDQDTLAILAEETGGEAFLNTNDFRSAFHGLVDEARSSYELAYPSPHPGDGRRHSIRVEVGRPGVGLRYRKSYHAKTMPERVQDGVFSSLLYGIEENPLAIRVVVEERGMLVDKRSRMRVLVKLPLEKLTLLPRGEHHSGLFTVYLAGRDETGAVTAIGRRSIPVRIADEGLREALERDYVYEVEIDLLRGRSHLAVGLRDEIGGETSYVTAVLQPPSS